MGPTVPTLGVCLGLQAAVVAFGGTVDLAPEPATARLHRSPTTVRVSSPDSPTRSRRLAITRLRRQLPDVLIPTAHSEDGVVQGVRHVSLPIEAVQFHPESVMTTQGKALLANSCVARCASGIQSLVPRYLVLPDPSVGSLRSHLRVGRGNRPSWRRASMVSGSRRRSAEVAAGLGEVVALQMRSDEGAAELAGAPGEPRLAGWGFVDLGVRAPFADGAVSALRVPWTTECRSQVHQGLIPIPGWVDDQ